MILYLVIKTSGVLHFDYEGEQKRNKIDQKETMNMKTKLFLGCTLPFVQIDVPSWFLLMLQKLKEKQNYFPWMYFAFEQIDDPSWFK